MTKGLDRRRVNKIFAILLVKYGHKWSSLITDEATLDLSLSIWSTTLSGVVDSKLKAALEMCAKEYPEWPPGPDQFRALCDFGKDHLPEFKSLPRPYSPPEIGEPAFEQLRGILRYKA